MWTLQGKMNAQHEKVSHPMSIDWVRFSPRDDAISTERLGKWWAPNLMHRTNWTVWSLKLWSPAGRSAVVVGGD